MFCGPPYSILFIFLLDLRKGASFRMSTAKKMNKESDKECWMAFLGGDKAAFSALFLKYHPILLNYGLRLCQNEALAEECIQDLFCYIYEKRDTLNPINHMKGYLFASYRRRVMQVCNKSVQTFPIEDYPTYNGHQSHEEEIIMSEIYLEKRHRLAQLLDALPFRQREVIFLKYYNGLDAAEIREVMGISHQGALNILYKAMKNLRRIAQ